SQRPPARLTTSSLEVIEQSFLFENCQCSHRGVARLHEWLHARDSVAYSAREMLDGCVAALRAYINDPLGSFGTNTFEVRNTLANAASGRVHRIRHRRLVQVWALYANATYPTCFLVLQLLLIPAKHIQ